MCGLSLPLQEESQRAALGGRRTPGPPLRLLHLLRLLILRVCHALRWSPALTARRAQVGGDRCGRLLPLPLRLRRRPCKVFKCGGTPPMEWPSGGMPLTVVPRLSVWFGPQCETTGGCALNKRLHPGDCVANILVPTPPMGNCHLPRGHHWSPWQLPVMTGWPVPQTPVVSRAGP